jgi:pyruvate/2-oxoglutarate dehydrogenase complex dihydrolipoamide dehydrogenase (E3) component
MEISPQVLPQDEYNKILVENVHPQDWINPESAPVYNLVVIGAGTAGLVTAAGAAGLGAKVALVERNLMGGDCLNVGCVPSKAIIRASRAMYDVKTATKFGVSGTTDAVLDFAKVMERMRRIRAEISAHDSVERFAKKLGVDVFLGQGRFTGSDTIEVAGKKLRFKKAAICTGARAEVPQIPGLAEAGYLTNETIFSLTELPKRIAIIGGGPIGAELAQAFARMGSRVTLFQGSKHLLPREDLDAADILHHVFVLEGIDLRLLAKVLKVEKRGTEKILSTDEQGKKFTLPVDEILIASGRTPNVEGLELEKAGIQYDPQKGVQVNERLQTTNPRVYAAGDICSSYKFTHSADALARIVIANALFKARQKTSALVIPWCTYTDPEVAHVGLYETEARDKGIEVLTLTVPFSVVDRARLDGETDGFARVHLKKGSDKILGATIVARHAGEMINELSLAMTAGLGLTAISKTIHPYPTQAEAIKQLADAYNRTRFTPFLKKLFNAWLSWQRK